MKTYIRKNVTGYYIEFPEEIDPEYWAGKIGTTYLDFLDGKWVLLSNELVLFHNEYPKASVEEVWNMQIVIPEPVVIPEPEPTQSYSLVELSENLPDSEKASIIANLGLNLVPLFPTLENLSNSLTELQRTAIINNLGLADNKAILELGQTHILAPNVHYNLGYNEKLEFTLGTPITGITNSYSFSFDSPQEMATLLILPLGVIWTGELLVRTGHHYEVTIIYNASNDLYYGKIDEW